MIQYPEIKLAVIGSGAWGINHVRTSFNLLKENLKIVCDSNPSRLSKINEISPGINFTKNLNDVLEDPEINTVIVATPAETHYAIAKQCLENNKHVLVEKPITLFSNEAKVLIKISESCKRKLMVGHVLLYHPVINKLKLLIREGMIGKLQYIYSNRLNLGKVRNEENILWSFAPHDISIIQYITETNPVAVEATGAKFLRSNIEDTTLTYLEYPDNIHAHIFVSWLHPFKEHRLVVIGDKGMFVFEDNLPDHKLKLYPKGFKNVNGFLEKFEGEFVSIQYNNAEPLEEEHKHFYSCILNDKQPLTDGQHAIEVLEILEKAQNKLNKNQQQRINN